jgi:CRISPR-associated protein Csb1
MSPILNRFDELLDERGPAALVIREQLLPVEGADGVVFPATFAASEDKTFKAGYNIDDFGNGKNVCLIDSVGSQANRIEPLFTLDGYRELVPQILVQAGTRKVNLLEAGHRAADAIVRCSALQESLQLAFRALLKGDATALAKIAPTSLVFGVWDSRDTQAKLPRLVSSTIRAFDVHPLTRSAQYVPAADYLAEGLLEDSDDRRVTDAHASRGFKHVPASGAPGGVIASAGIRRDATLHLAALRLLLAGTDAEKTQRLRRYILGLALSAFTYSAVGYLRQGCNLVPDPDRKREFTTVFYDGTRKPSEITHAGAVEYAKAVAAAFGVGDNREVPFDPARALAEVNEAGEGKKTKASKTKKNG